MRRERLPRVALRRPRPGLAGAARPEPAARLPRHPDRGWLLASVPRPRAARGGRGGRAHQRRSARRAVGRHGRPASGEVDGAHARPARGAGHVRSGRGVRLPRRADLAGAAVDAGSRPRVDLPDRAGAAPPPAALPLLQPRVPAPLHEAAAAREVPAKAVLDSGGVATSVAIVGLGRIGLPLALSFADRGLKVVGIDKDPAVLRAIGEERLMPFHETGTQELLERVVDSGRLELSARLQAAAAADHIVLTLGTPAFSHIEIDVAQIRSALEELLPLLH